MSFVQVLAELPNLSSIPSNYTYFANSNEPPASDLQDLVPVIDFSLLTSTDPDQRSKVIKELDHVCKGWGFFQVPVIYLQSVSSYMFFFLPLSMIFKNCLGYQSWRA